MSNFQQMIATPQDSISDLGSQMTENKLQLSEHKTEVLFAIQSRFKTQPSPPSSICIKCSMVPVILFFTSGRQPRSHPWSNTHLQTAHFKHLQNSLLWMQKNQFSPSLSLCWCHKNTRVFLCFVKAGLLQLSSSWIPKVASPQAT